MTGKPNVIFIMIDQLREDILGSGAFSSLVSLPNMEALKRESVYFNRFYASALPCVPSRACFLIGKNAWNFNCCSNARFYDAQERMNPLDKTWMQALREAGYVSVSVGKTHLVHAGSHHIPVQPENSFGEQDGWDHFHPQASEAGDRYLDLRIAETACRTLDRLVERPFALFVGFHAPHEPYTMPEKYLNVVSPDQVDLPRWRSENDEAERSESFRRRIAYFRRLFGDAIDDDETIRRAIAAYLGEVKMIDDCLGQLLQKVRDLGQWDNTLIVFTADHGEMLGEHHLFNKNATCYEGECHIPFMMKLPGGLHAGEQVNALAAGIDWYPTAMELLNVEPDTPLPGYSLLPCMEEGAEVRDHVLIWYDRCSMALLTERYKLMIHPHDGDGELYDLLEDPHEMRNLYHLPEYAQLRLTLAHEALRQRMLEDNRCSLVTKRESLMHHEMYTAYETEVGPVGPAQMVGRK